MQSTIARQAAARRHARRLGLRLQKSRARYWRHNDQQGWMVIDADRNTVVDGVDFELTLQDVERVLTRYEAAARKAAA